MCEQNPYKKFDELVQTFNAAIDSGLEDEDFTIGIRALEALASVLSYGIDAAISSLQHQESLVRVTAIETIAYTFRRSLVGLIREHLRDSDWLVRREAAFALAEADSIADITLLESMLEHAEEEERPGLLFALTSLGRSEYADEFFAGLRHPYYRIRCFTANVIPLLLHRFDRDFLTKSLVDAQSSEKLVAPLSSIESSLRELE